MNKYSEYYYEVIEKYKLFHENGIKRVIKAKLAKVHFWVIPYQDGF